MKILPLALAFFDGKIREQLTGMTTTAKSLAVVGALATVSAVFFLTALTVVLASRIGIVGACLAMSALFALLAAVIYLRYNRARRSGKAIRAERVAIAASADTVGGAGAGMLLHAFLRGFRRK